ncbi:MAG: hypothetical protein WC935_04105 [Thermoleophilia bacterium]
MDQKHYESRQVGGAFGVAILGSILNTIYTSNMAESVSGLPPDAAVNIAARIGGPRGEALANAARESFVGGMHTAFLVSAAVALLAAVMVYRFMPAQHLGGKDHAGGA